MFSEEERLSFTVSLHPPAAESLRKNLDGHTAGYTAAAALSSHRRVALCCFSCMVCAPQ